jgi:hypothetical protein
VIKRLAKSTLLLCAIGEDRKAEEHNAIEEKQVWYDTPNLSISKEPA